MTVFINLFYFGEMDTFGFPLALQLHVMSFFFFFREENEVIFEETDTLISEM